MRPAAGIPWPHPFQAPSHARVHLKQAFARESSFTVEGDTAGGANVTLPEATATDIVDPAPIVSCDQAFGFFPLGLTTVNCTATDETGNQTNGSYTVTVEDNTPPNLTVPASLIPS